MRRLTALMPVVLWACIPRVPASNPYDPDVPPEQQQKASVFGVVYGDLLDGSDPAALAGATVELDGPTIPANSPSSTDSDGVFRFNDLIPGTYGLDVFHPAFFRQGRDLILDPGDVREMDAILVLLPQTGSEDTGHITGVVLVEAQIGLALEDHSGVLVEVQDAGIRTVTNTAGVYDLFLAAGSYLLDFSAQDHLAQTSAQVDVTEGATVIVPGTTLLANPGYVAGTVVLVDADGNGEADHSGVSIGVPGTPITPVDTAPNGSFTLQAPAGIHSITASIDGHDNQVIPGVVVHGGITTTVSDAIIMPFSRGDIVGHAELGGGASDHSGITASLDDIGRASMTNSAGDFVISGVPVGVHPLTASRDGYFPATVGAVQVYADVDNVVQDLILAKKEGNFQIRSLNAASSAGCTNAPLVQLVLIPPVGTTEIKITGDLDATESADWQAYPLTPDANVLLDAASEGSKTLSVAFSDGTTQSGPFSASIVLDTRPPDLDMLPGQDLAVIIDGGAEWSDDDTASAPQVTLTFVADDLGSGLRSMQISEDNSFSDSVPVTYVPLKIFSFASDPPDGAVNTVYVRFIDHAGSWSNVVSADIKFDRLDPVVDVITIDCNGVADSAYCDSPLVELSITASDPDPGSGNSGVALMALSNASGFPVIVWEPYDTFRIWPLSSGINPRSVYILVQDFAGNISATASDAVNLDTVAPTAVRLVIHGTDAGGSSTVLTRTPSVLVDLSATDANLGSLYLANDNDFSNLGAMTGYAPGAGQAWPLAAGLDGSRTVYMLAMDLAGNAVSTSASIQLDQTPPLLTGIGLVGRNVDGSPNLTATASTSVELEIDAIGADRVYVDVGTPPADCTALSYSYTQAEVRPYSPFLPFTIGAAATETVWACVADEAGNFDANVSSATISVDQTPPSGCILTLAGHMADGSAGPPPAAWTGLPKVDVTVSLCSEPPPQMALSTAAAGIDCASASYSTYVSPSTLSLPAGNGAHDIVGCFRDAVGHVFGPTAAGVTIRVDQTPPTGVTASFQSGTWATGTAATLNGSAVDPGAPTTGAGLGQMYASGDVVGSPLATAFATTWPSLTLSAGADGPRVVVFEVSDRVGNVSQSVTVVTTLDTAPPSLAPIIVMGRNVNGTPNATASASPTVDLSISAGGASWLYIDTNVAPPDCSAAGIPMSSYATPYAPFLSWTLTGGSVHVCVADQAGNRAGPESATITIDTAPPSVPPSTVNGGVMGEKTADPLATVTYTVTDADTSVAGVALGLGALNCTNATFALPATGPATVALALGDGAYTLQMCARDAVGNITAVATPAANSVVLDTTGPPAPALQVLDITGDGFALGKPDASSPSTVELSWSVPSVGDLYEFELQLLVAGQDDDFVTLPYTFGPPPFPATIELADDVDATVGATHFYRVRARDDVLNYSGWSNIAVAVPFEPIGGVGWFRDYDSYRYEFPPNPETFSIESSYAYEDSSWIAFLGLLLDGITSWERPEPATPIFEETLTLRTANQPNTLVYDSVVPLRINEHLNVDEADDVGEYSSLALDAAGNAYISYYDKTNDQLKYATNAAGSWTTAVVDDGGDGPLGVNVGNYTSIGVDSTSAVHISYYDLTNTSLKYARGVSGVWSTETIDTVGANTSLAIDASDTVHIGYYDGANDQLKYATGSFGAWSTTVVDDGGDGPGGVNVGNFTSLAVDGAGKAHLSYLDSTNNEVKYANNVTGAWAVQTIGATDSNASQNPYTSIAVGGAGDVHISYVGSIGVWDLTYATNATGPWTTESVDTIGRYSSLALDPDGSVHIAYYSGGLRFASKLYGGWSNQLLDGTGNSGRFASLAFDPDGRPHFAYLAQTFEDLRYLHLGGWTNHSPDPSAPSVGRASLALDAAERVHIAFYDRDSDQLKIATNIGAWAAEVVDDGGDGPLGVNVGYEPSIAIDSTGARHISYYDATNLDLKYVTDGTGSWTPTVVDPSRGGAGAIWDHTSLAVDSTDAVHIAYCHSSLQQLRYATNAGGPWSTELVDDGGGAGRHLSLAVDSANTVHISYADSTGALKLASGALGAWTTQVLIATNDAWETSIFVDAADNLHIAYRDVNNHDLRYANNVSGWTFQTLYSEGVTGVMPSIVVDGGGAVHIAFGGKYMTNAPGSWVTVRIAISGPSLAIDSGGRAHISYTGGSSVGYTTGIFYGFQPAASIERTTTF